MGGEGRGRERSKQASSEYLGIALVLTSRHSNILPTEIDGTSYLDLAIMILLNLWPLLHRITILSHITKALKMYELERPFGNFLSRYNNFLPELYKYFWGFTG